MQLAMKPMGGYLDEDYADADGGGNDTSMDGGIGNLLAAHPGTALIKEGWLRKSDPYGANWKQRWCVLMPTSFCYYESADKRDASLKGAFELRSAKLIPGWSLNRKSPSPWLFQLQLSSRHYYFSAGTQGELTEWLLDIERVLAALQNRPADYEALSIERPLGEGAHGGLTRDTLFDPHSIAQRGGGGGGGGGGGEEEEAYGQYPGPPPRSPSGYPGGSGGDAFSARGGGYSGGGTLASARSTGGAGTPPLSASARRPLPAAPAPAADTASAFPFSPLAPAQRPQSTQQALPHSPQPPHAAVVATVGQLQAHHQHMLLAGGGAAQQRPPTGRAPGVQHSHLPHGAVKPDFSALPPPLQAVLSPPAHPVNLDGSFADALGSGGATPLHPQTQPQHGQALGGGEEGEAGAGAASSGGADGGTGGNITFYVVTGEVPGAEEGEPDSQQQPPPMQRTWTMMAKRSTLGSLTILKLKKRLSKATGIDPGVMTLTIDGDDTVLADDWSAEDISLTEGGSLRVHFTAPVAGSSGSEAEGLGGAPVPPPRTAAATKKAKRAAAAAAAAAAATVAAAAAAAAVASAVSEEEQQQQQQVEEGAPSSASPPRVNLGGSGSSSGLSAPLDRRLHMRRIFNSIAGDPFSTSSPGRGGGGDRGDGAGSPGAVLLAVDRADFAAALASDPAVCAYPEYEPLIRALVTLPPPPVPSTAAGGAPPAPRGDPLSITWDHFSDLIRDAGAAVAAAAAGWEGPVPPAGASGPTAPSLPQVISPPRPAAPASPAPEAGARRGAGARGADASPAAAAGPPAPRPAARAPSSSPSAPTRRHVMVMTIDVSPGVSEEIHVGVGDDPDAIAAAFVASHRLFPAEQHTRPLAEEVRRTLVEAYALELADATTAARAAEGARDKARADAAAASGLLASIQANAEVAADDAERKVRAAIARAEAAEARASSSAAAAAGVGRELDGVRAALAAASVRATESSRVAEEAGREAEAARAAAAALSAAAAEGSKRASAWDRAMSGGLGVGVRSALLGATTAPGSGAPAPGGGDGGDWRVWAEEKRALLSRFNADLAVFVEENKRLRAALDGRGLEAEARLRAADEANASLATQAQALETAKARAEAELRAVYLQWREETRRWGTEGGDTPRGGVPGAGGGASAGAVSASLRANMMATQAAGGVAAANGAAGGASLPPHGDVASLLSLGGPASGSGWQRGTAAPGPEL